MTSEIVEKKEPPTPKKIWKAPDLILLLRARYPAASYAFFEQVNTGTGSFSRGWIDAVVVSLWPSNGLHRMAFEVKVSRSDFLNEMDNPQKNKAYRDKFHQFWYVAPKDVAKEEELPAGCGLLVPRGDKVVVARAASHNDKPEMSDSLFAAMARSLSKSADEQHDALRRELMANDREIQQAMMAKRALEKFLQMRKDPLYFYNDPTVDEIVTRLEKATMDKKTNEEAEIFYDRLNDFQDGIARLFEAFLVLAHVGISERDEAGRLLSRYGIHDKQMFAKLTARAKTNRKSNNDHIQRLRAMKDLFDDLLPKKK